MSDCNICQLSMKSIILILVLAFVHLKSALSLNQTVLIPLSVIVEDKTGACFTQQQRDATLESLRNTIGSTLGKQCGAGLWIRVAYLNMSDPSQSCPPAWRENTTSGVRVCGRPSNSSDMCHGAFYFASLTYTTVCGQVIGYQVGHTNGFHCSRTINEPYVDGVSITHGSP